MNTEECIFYTLYKTLSFNKRTTSETSVLFHTYHCVRWKWGEHHTTPSSLVLFLCAFLCVCIGVRMATYDDV